MNGFATARVAAGVLASTGMLRPVGPVRLLRMAAAFRRHGVNLPAAVAAGAARWPDRPALIDDDGPVTFPELYRRVGDLAADLADRYGLRAGRRLGVLCRNHRGFVEAALAGSWLGAELVFLNTDFSRPQLAEVLKREDVHVLMHDDEFSALAGDLPVTLVSAECDRRPGGSRRPPPPYRGHGRIVILTSGTTGTPKGAARDTDPARFALPLTTMLTQLRLRSGEPMLVLPPLFHGFGLAYLAIALVLGSPLVLCRRFEPERALELAERHRVRSMFAVPVMLQRILRLPPHLRDGRRTGLLRAVGSAAAPLSPDLAAEFQDVFGDVLFNLYGSTETSWSTIATPADLRAAPGTVGRPARGIEVRVLDEHGRELPAGRIGTVFVGSRMAFHGYTGGGGKEVVRGLLNTGDVGHFDQAGRLFIDGRADDMIVSGGENVYPQEVEDLLAGHPGLLDVVVRGVEDEEFGQRLAARAVRVPGGTVTEDELKAYVKANLARYKVPREIEFVDELPRTASGKLRR
ncbi:AMP-binding protein [Amycolatopsis nigrescens]|uniref:AMP-binding protein n=1 Tax=Amycolatopsis nigrescens TaxID=381445 RepID=UPI000379B78D|nr:AMP-binding protein [Amycolatopsis nigrescens]